jgi:hypothetical protein
LGGAVNVGSLTTIDGGTTAINTPTVTTTGAQVYGDNVTLGASTTLDSNGITFSRNLTGGTNNLTLDSSGLVQQGLAANSSLSGAGLSLLGTGAVNLPNSGNDFDRLRVLDGVLDLPGHEDGRAAHGAGAP